MVMDQSRNAVELLAGVDLQHVDVVVFQDPSHTGDWILSQIPRLPDLLSRLLCGFWRLDGSLSDRQHGRILGSQQALQTNPLLQPVAGQAFNLRLFFFGQAGTLPVGEYLH